jgi:hypothetical protein
MKKTLEKAESKELGDIDKNTQGEAPIYRFTGHETFACRYSWLPKAYSELIRDPELFSNEENAMVRLGVGRNMVKSIRFWVQVTGIAKATRQILQPTDLGRKLLDEESGFDPYLEDIRTLWLIHWMIASNAREPLFAWEFLFNRWQHPELCRTHVLDVFQSEAARMDRTLSNVTLDQHFDTFLHTYVPTRSLKGDVREDNLDSPLVELNLIRSNGEKRSTQSGRPEAIYIFNRDPKPSITPELFSYCIQDYWQSRFPNEETISFRDISVAVGSVGQIFKLPETDIRERLETVHADSKGFLAFRESSAISHLTRNTSKTYDPLMAIFEAELIYA